MQFLKSLTLFLDIADSEDDLIEKYDLNIMQDHAFEFLNKHVDDLYSSISFFHMYIYSLLIVSDVYASEKYDLPYDEVKNLNFDCRIDSNLLQQMKDSYYNISHNKNINYEYCIENLDEIENIDILRKQMLLESSKNLVNYLSDNNVFFLHMPTGGGKTNTSMKLALDILENTDADRIIYAMPLLILLKKLSM